MTDLIAPRDAHRAWSPRTARGLGAALAVMTLACLAPPLSAAPVIGSEKATRTDPAGEVTDAYTPAGSERPTRADALAAWKLGRSQMAAGQLPAAAESFGRAAKLEPQAYAPLLGLADVALRRSELGRADTLLAQARTLAPRSAEVAAVSGRLHVAQRRTAEAEADFRRAIELDPAFPTPRLDLADLMMAGGRSDEAAAAYRAALQAAPRHAGAAFGLGRALALRKDLDGARKAFERSAELAPQLPQPRLALAEVLAAQKSFAEAHAQLDRVQQLPRSELAARTIRVNVWLADERTNDAIAEQQNIINALRGPEAALALVKLGQIHELAGRPGEAAAAYRKATEVDPRAHAAWNNAAWVAAERKLNLDRALADARQAVELAPGNANYHDTLGAVFMARGEHDKAVVALKRAVELAPGAPQPKARLAEAQAQAGTR